MGHPEAAWDNRMRWDGRQMGLARPSSYTWTWEASTGKTVVIPLQGCNMQRRCLHIASSLPFAEGSGVGLFLSTKSLDLLRKIQRDHINALNQTVRGTSSRLLNDHNSFLGTSLDQLSIHQLMQRTHNDSNHCNLFATASQIWNMDFFLQGLSPEPIHQTDKLVELIEQSFGSFQKFLHLFQIYAESMAGPGYLWLMHKRAANGSGRLQIHCTFGSGSPLFNSVPPPTFNQGSSRLVGSAPGSSPNGGLFSNFSFTSLVNDGKYAAKPPSTMDKPAEPIINNKIMPMAPQPIDTRVPSETDKPLPVLGLNLWEHAYLLDYSTDKKRYVNQFWSSVNWNRVAVMLNLY